MAVQIALRLEPGLADSPRAAGTTLSEWTRRTIRREAAAATGLRARTGAVRPGVGILGRDDRLDALPLRYLVVSSDA